MSDQSLAITLEKLIMQNPVSRSSFGVVKSFGTVDSVALTFDDGPDPKHTPKLLDILDRYDAKATFFVIGQRAEAHPEIISEMKRRGHAIGNHSHHHSSFTFLSWRQRVDEIKKCERRIGAGKRKLFRPPYGHLSRLTPLVAALMGYDTICWSVDGRDWESDDPRWMFQNLKQQTVGGSIVLLHDAMYSASDRRYFDRMPTLNLVDRYLDFFTGIYKFVTVTDMFRRATPLRAYWDIGITPRELEDRKAEIARLTVNCR